VSDWGLEVLVQSALARNLFSGLLKGDGMNESDFLAGGFSDEFLHEQADAGDYFLDEEGFHYRPTQYEMQMLALEGRALLFIDSFKGK
jgi:hypothetical protein